MTFSFSDASGQLTAAIIAGVFAVAVALLTWWLSRRSGSSAIESAVSTGIQQARDEYRELVATERAEDKAEIQALRKQHEVDQATILRLASRGHADDR